MNKQYIVRDNQEIYGVYNDIAFAYVSILQYIYITIKNTKCSVETLIESFQIFEYNNNITENIYNIGHDLYLYDINKKIVVCDNISVRDYTTKINNMDTSNDINSKDMDIFLPMTEVTENRNSRAKTELEGKLKMLQNIKEQEEKKLTELKNQTIEEKNIINDNKNKETFIQTMYDNDIKRKEEKKKKLIADIQVFMTLRKEMDDGTREMDVVPEMFEDDYKIFMEMMEFNILEKSDNEKFEYYYQKKQNDPKFKSEFSKVFDQPNIEELKNLCFSDTESIYDDEYDENSDSEQSLLPDNDPINNIELMEKIINED